MKTVKFEEIEIGGHFLTLANRPQFGLHYKKTAYNMSSYGEDADFHFMHDEIVTPIKWTGGKSECHHFKPMRWRECVNCGAQFEFIPQQQQ